MEDGETQKFVTKMAAMGRRFQLGNLYDYRCDRTIVGGKSKKICVRMFTHAQKHNAESNLCPFIADTQMLQLCQSATKVEKINKFKLERPETMNKWEIMKLDNHLQASVMAGLVDKYRGSSNYINDQLNPLLVNQILVYRIRDRKEHLDWKPEFLPLYKESQLAQTTHIVCGVTYGAEAYCVLTRDLDGSVSETRQEAEGKLSKAVTKMENALADKQETADFRNQFDEEERAQLMRLVKCRLYTDGQSQIVREGDIFDVYKHLHQFAINCHQMIPVKVLILPLNNILDSKNIAAIRLVGYRDVDADLVDGWRRLWTDLEGMRARAKVADFREFEKTIQQYQKLVMEKLNKSIVNARGENGDDAEVKRAIEIAEMHPLFKPSQLEQWLHWKENEIKMTRLVREMTGITIKTAKKELDMKLVESKKRALVLNIPALDKETNKILKQMNDYVNSYKILVAVSFDDENNETKIPWHVNHDEQIKAKSTIRDLAEHMKRNESKIEEKNQLQFFITYGNDSIERFSHHYSIYYSNDVLESNVTGLPGPPTGIRIYKETTTDSHSSGHYRVVWQYEEDAANACHFLVEFRPKNSSDGSWTQRKTNYPGEKQLTLQFEQEETMEIRVAIDTFIGIGEFSNTIDTQSAIDGVEDRVILNLEELPDEEETLDAARRVSSSSSVMSLTTLLNRGIRFAEELVSCCKKINNITDMEIYTIPLKKSTTLITNDGITTMERYVLDLPGGKKDSLHRTILMMGATGSGKTTLINAMINYIFNVKWEDNFRFHLLEHQHSAASQTNCITVYDIPHVDGFRVPYSLTIVDTPGYVDTKYNKDKEITEMIRQFFTNKEGIQQLDVVGFVIPASLPRLTSTQMYIFDSVLSIFGKDVKENINFLLTFSDTQIPPVMSAIIEANLPCLSDEQSGQPLYHKFNNSGFFCSNKSSSDSDHTLEKFFWKMGMENFEKFFNELAAMTTKSLSLTKEVLEERKRLEAAVEGLQPLIKIGLYKMKEMRKTNDVIKNCLSQIEANENVKFDVKVTVPKKVKIPDGVFANNCNKCRVTCHYPCKTSDEREKYRCHAMTFNPFVVPSNRTCRICPENCIWSSHSSKCYKWENVTETRKISSDAIKEKYEKALKKKKLTAEELIKVMENDVKEIDRNVLKRVEIVSRCIKRLDEIALRENPSSTLQYIDLLIDTEMQEKKEGFVERIESLKKLRQMTEITLKVANNETLLQA